VACPLDVAVSARVLLKLDGGLVVVVVMLVVVMVAVVV